MDSEEKIVLSKTRHWLYEKCLKKAKKLIPSKKKLSKKIKKARKIADRLQNLPRCNKLSAHVCNFCDLLSDYLDGEYLNLPLATLVALLAGLLYLILPFDAIADIIPGIGWIDDAAVLAFVLAAEQNDVNEYLKWKEDQAKIIDVEN